jgi:hypothetical protein
LLLIKSLSKSKLIYNSSTKKNALACHDIVAVVHTVVVAIQLWKRMFFIYFFSTAFESTKSVKEIKVKQVER